MDERPRERPDDGGSAAERDGGLDPTREFEGPADRTAKQPPLDDTAPHRALDDTAPHRAADDTGPEGGLEGTASERPRHDVVPGPAVRGADDRPSGDETRRLTAADRTRSLPVTPGAWSGRAEVRPHSVREVRETGPVAWDTSADQDGRRWWLPILIGLIVLLLLGVLAFGIWLIVKSRENEPAPITSASPSAISTTASASPTSAPTTGQSSPSPTAPATVTVPTLVGLPEGAAREKLDELGLTYRLQFRDSNQPPGTVIETDPEAGAEVERDTLITLVIAEAAPAPPPPTSDGPGRPKPSPTATVDRAG